MRRRKKLRIHFELKRSRFKESSITFVGLDRRKAVASLKLDKSCIAYTFSL
jgi:hypothetical protein